MKQSGIIFNIQRYTIHDGPGIRTELFLKGCPLSCLWCSNPESQAKTMQPGIYTSKCLGTDKCGSCKSACQSEGSLIFKEGKLAFINQEICTGCMKCADLCPADAIKPWGQLMHVEEVMEIVRRDMEYYRSSQGGVTISGGEPLMQSAFAAEILKACQKEQIHTCLESTFCTDWNMIEEVIPYADLLITDIKHMDAKKHRQYTGVSNEKILKNIHRLTELKKRLIIRIPVIPGVNDDMDNMKATADYIIETLKNRVQQLQLLGFMRLGEEKYASIGRNYPMADRNVDQARLHEQIGKLSNYFKQRGIRCIAGTTVSENGGAN